MMPSTAVRHSLDSKINFSAENRSRFYTNNNSSMKAKSSTSSSSSSSSTKPGNRSLSLTPKSSISQPCSYQNDLLISNKTSHRNSTKNNNRLYLQRRLRNSTDNSNESRVSSSSINSLFLMNRVRSFTWRLKRHLIQTSIDSDSIPPEALRFPVTKLNSSLDNFSNSKIGSMSSGLPKRQSASVRVRKRSNQRNIPPLRHSSDANMNTTEIICSHDDFKKILAKSSNSSIKKHNTINYIDNKKFKHTSLKEINLKLYSSFLSNTSDPLVKVKNHIKTPRRSSSESSLYDLNLYLNSTNDIDKSDSISKTDLVKLGEIRELVDDKEPIENPTSPSLCVSESIYNFTTPNIQILGDAIQQHLKFMMNFQFSGDYNYGIKHSPKIIPKSNDLSNVQKLMTNTISQNKHLENSNFIKSAFSKYCISCVCCFKMAPNMANISHEKIINNRKNDIELHQIF